MESLARAALAGLMKSLRRAYGFAVVACAEEGEVIVLKLKFQPRPDRSNRTGQP